MNNIAGISIQSTAGAVPVRNDKGKKKLILIQTLRNRYSIGYVSFLIPKLFAGEVSMQKVKVHRYVSGKRPDYAPMSSSEEESEEDDFIEQKRRHLAVRPLSPAETMEKDVQATGEVYVDDPRLRRLKTRKKDDRGEESEDENRVERHRLVFLNFLG